MYVNSLEYVRYKLNEAMDKIDETLRSLPENDDENDECYSEPTLEDLDEVNEAATEAMTALNCAAFGAGGLREIVRRKQYEGKKCEEQ